MVIGILTDQRKLHDTKGKGLSIENEEKMKLQCEKE